MKPTVGLEMMATITFLNGQNKKADNTRYMSIQARDLNSIQYLVKHSVLCSIQV